ncbi:MAG: hypothetical protein DLM69_04540 [Candidatus Chloroheliales bacterium]|nr:MAG: hypothetical protein DLM69_04540 [Chloroflexota bacterium]
MFKHILALLDGSPCSERTLNLAATVARVFNAEVTLLCVVEDKDSAADEQFPASLTQASAYLDRVAHHLAEYGLSKVKTEVKKGRATEVVPTAARSGYDLVVLNTRVICDTYRHTGVMKRMLGSVAQSLVRSTQVPLLMVGNYGSVARYSKPGFSFERILVPLDGSLLAEQALPLALGFAKASGCSLFLFMVRGPAASQSAAAAWDEATPSRYLEVVAARYKGDGVRISSAAREGKPALDISAAASALDCDLIVMATHGNVGAEGLNADPASVTEQVVIKSSVPILLLRGQEKES